MSPFFILNKKKPDAYKYNKCFTICPAIIPFSGKRLLNCNNSYMFASNFEIYNHDENIF